MKASWLEELNKALRSAGVPRQKLSITRHLTERGAPVPLPKIYHLPSIGYLRAAEIAQALAALQAADLDDMDADAADYLEDVRGWLQACANSGRDLICFYV